MLIIWYLAAHLFKTLAIPVTMLMSLILASYPVRVPMWVSAVPALCTAECSCLKSAESSHKPHVLNQQRKWSAPLTWARPLNIAIVPDQLVNQSLWDRISCCKFFHQHLLALLLSLGTLCSTFSGAWARDTREAYLVILVSSLIRDNRTTEAVQSMVRPCLSGL